MGKRLFCFFLGFAMVCLAIGILLGELLPGSWELGPTFKMATALTLLGLGIALVMRAGHS